MTPQPNLPAWYRQSWAVPPKPSLSEWADANRYLSLESNPTGGKWHTDTVPYLREIMDTITDPHYEKVIWMAPSQAGKTEGTELNFVGWIMDQDPGPVLVIHETIDNARSWSKDRFEPMMRDTPCLRGKVSTARGLAAQEQISSNEVLHKSFPGGHITVVGSNSGAGLSMRPIRYILADEVDAWAPSAGEEGDQLDLAEKRATWFFNRKIVVISSPRLKATSRIEPLYLKSDQRKYYVPCPHCETYQLLVFGKETFCWEKGPGGEHLPETAHFICVSCRGRIREQDKVAMLAKGEWRATFPGRPIAGFRLWAAYSPVVLWATLAQEYLDSHKNPEKYKVFVNTRLAETWEEKGDAPAWEPLRDRAEQSERQLWVVPAGVGFLTVGADVQHDRIEYSVWGWGREEQSWLIGHDAVYGNTDTEEPYQLLEQKLAQQYSQPSRGQLLPVLATFLDSGFKTQEVYWFARTRGNVHAIKGANQSQAKVVETPTLQDIDHRGQRIKDGVLLWQVGVHGIKKMLYGRLKLTKPGPRFIHLPQGLPDDYYQQLTAEKLIVSGTKEEWRRDGRNEALDCAVYAYAAARYAGLVDPRTNWDQLCPGGEVKAGSMPAIPQPVANQQPVRQRGIRGGGGTMQGLLKG